VLTTRTLAKQAVKKDKTNPEAQFILGESYLALAKFKESLEHGSTGRSLIPPFPLA